MSGSAGKGGRLGQVLSPRGRGRSATDAPGDAPGDVGAPSLRALSIRVALAASAIVGVAYLVIAVAGAVVVSNDLTGRVDRNLVGALDRVTGQVLEAGHDFGAPPPDRLGGLPLLVWTVHGDGTVSNVGASNAVLPDAFAHVGAPQTISISGVDVRITGDYAGNGVGYVVVGQSMDPVRQTESTLVVAEIGIGFALLAFVFLGAVAIGRRVAGPIDRARQRQLEFTADASHELRTPLAVIEAQTSLALTRERSQDWYRSAFQRVGAESHRMRRLVDDMLWLARFDATRGQPSAEPVDVNVLAAQTADRFRIVAEARHLDLSLHESGDTSIVTVPPEWLDRLLGVLLDNACKYAPEGGSVSVRVANESRRVRLTVGDSGPGIAVEDRERVFDRFHRATDAAGGSGLGLAIADAVVRATNGRWHLGSSPDGGASFSVSWQRSLVGQPGDPREAPSEATATGGQARASRKPEGPS